MMMRKTALAMTLAAMAMPGVAQKSTSPAPPPAAALCADAGWRTAFTDGALTCAPAKAGVVIAPAAEAAGLATLLDVAADSYAAHFARPRRPAAVVSGGTVTAEQAAMLRGMGYMALPWLSDAQRRQMVEGSVRTQVRAAQPDATPAALDAMVAQAMMRMPTAQVGGAIERGSLAHELAHGWFRETHDAGRVEPAPVAGATRYGSSAPDWLDEMAAVLAENDTLTSARRASLKTYAAGAGDDGLYPLATFLTMEHPVLRAAVAMRDANAATTPAGGASVIKVSGEEAKALLARTGNPGRFYAQARGFADFLIARSGDPRIFASIGDASARGIGFESWLKTQGAAHRLPVTLTALDAAWLQWMKAR